MPTLNGYEALSVDTKFPAYAERFDDSASTAHYYGLAQVGTTATATAWRIWRKEFQGSTSAYVIKYAGTSANFDKKWSIKSSYNFI